MRAVEHYLEAEEQIKHAEQARADGDPVEQQQLFLAAAQANATLALAGAMAMQAYVTANDSELDDWADAAGGAP